MSLLVSSSLDVMNQGKHERLSSGMASKQNFPTAHSCRSHSSSRTQTTKSSNLVAGPCGSLFHDFQLCVCFDGCETQGAAASHVSRKTIRESKKLEVEREVASASGETGPEFIESPMSSPDDSDTESISSFKELVNSYHLKRGSREDSDANSTGTQSNSNELDDQNEDDDIPIAEPLPPLATSHSLDVYAASSKDMQKSERRFKKKVSFNSKVLVFTFHSAQF